ncbi:hypothetical protein B9057_10250 [Aestuarium zhoushanense]|nr:hypothetical protein B9057_10250 [Aestuarium zhoushanense]
MRKKSLKVSLGKVGFHFFQLKIGRTPRPSIRVMNYDFRPNTGKKPFSQALVNVSAIGDAQRHPVLAFKGEVVSREVIEQPALRLVK